MVCVIDTKKYSFIQMFQLELLFCINVYIIII